MNLNIGFIFDVADSISITHYISTTTTTTTCYMQPPLNYSSAFFPSPALGGYVVCPTLVFGTHVHQFSCGIESITDGTWLPQPRQVSFSIVHIASVPSRPSYPGGKDGDRIRTADIAGGLHAHFGCGLFWFFFYIYVWAGLVVLRRGLAGDIKIRSRLDRRHLREGALGERLWSMAQDITKKK